MSLALVIPALSTVFDSTSRYRIILGIFPVQVDMMISMVDGDGDGQVSLEEFHRLIIDPDPSRPDFGNEPTKVDRTTAAAVTQASLLLTK